MISAKLKMRFSLLAAEIWCTPTRYESPHAFFTVSSEVGELLRAEVLMPPEWLLLLQLSSGALGSAVDHCLGRSVLQELILDPETAPSDDVSLLLWTTGSVMPPIPERGRSILFLTRFLSLMALK